MFRGFDYLQGLRLCKPWIPVTASCAKGIRVLNPSHLGLTLQVLASSKEIMIQLALL